jgi:hypothetical protein
MKFLGLSETRFRTPLPVFSKIRQNSRSSFFVTKLMEMFLLTKIVDGFKFFTMESGVTPKCDTDFQTTPYHNIFRIRLR